MQKRKPLHLFQAYGVELEYMIVDKNTLNVKPIADELLKAAAGDYVDEFENGPVTWSNELVRHVIELKCSQPSADLWKLGQDFATNIRQINQLLTRFDAKLMPSAAHPWMNPAEETQLWPYGNKEIYETYDRIFNCKGHGWSNLQSTHLNLPFSGDDEFARLHAAIRVLMPIMPALTASSPILESQYTGKLDKRLDYYQQNQKRIPQITGRVIPEQAFNKADYQKLIYDPITQAAKPLDKDNVLEAVWLNSRGAIARFDRGSIEIRILDIQESPMADLAILNLITHVLKMLIEGKLIGLEEQQQWTVDSLYTIFQNIIQDAENTNIENIDYLSLFQWKGSSARAKQLWMHLYKLVQKQYPEAMQPWTSSLDTILLRGSLGSRILNLADGIYNRENLKLIYGELCDCLEENETFETWHPMPLS
ncbi:carboxylate-amine ligase [Catalinimonas niigatensis]|uniref:carboxylate-amine ligase n=1 Tax=Catalinimonas niigatensis TaxID=1397264 RepID=UPI002664EF7B|nr:glutamate-cysteine ligase family protein [Catalinimonas niigatensis]WPP50912.1 glutamate-cysteine ligase family protein [Catalinimonas niigatensis]